MDVKINQKCNEIGPVIPLTSVSPINVKEEESYGESRQSENLEKASEGKPFFVAVSVARCR